MYICTTLQVMPVYTGFINAFFHNVILITSDLPYSFLLKLVVKKLGKMLHAWAKCCMLV